MERKNTLSMLGPEIVHALKKKDLEIFRYSDIRTIFSAEKRAWKLQKETTISDFIKFLLKNTKLTKRTFKFPSHTETRYIWGDPSIYGIALSLKSGSYFTHHTAMHLHRLIRKAERTIFLNFEQPPHYSDSGELTQEAIDAAFTRPQRISRNIAPYKGKKICILNGMHTGRLGVIGIKGPKGEELPVTNIERTLIDIVVRPYYSGGVPDVLNAYKRAKGKVSLKKLIYMLERLDYVYPYHQAVGFYLERAGYEGASINQFRDFGMNYDFYLAHDMNEMGYSEEWRIFFPKYL